MEHASQAGIRQCEHRLPGAQQRGIYIQGSFRQNGFERVCIHPRHATLHDVGGRAGCVPDALPWCEQLILSHAALATFLPTRYIPYYPPCNGQVP